MDENKFELEEKKPKKTAAYYIGRAIGSILFYTIAICLAALLLAVTAKLILRMF